MIPPYPTDAYGNCSECGGGYEGSIPHMPDCKYAIRDTQIQVQVQLLHELNAMAEADIIAGNPITGAHHRAIEKKLKELQ